MNKLTKIDIPKYTQLDTYNENNPHSIFEIIFDNKSIIKLSENITSFTYTDNLLIIDFISYNYLINDEYIDKITDEDIEQSFKNKPYIILRNANRNGNIIEHYKFTECEFVSITDNLYDYTLQLNDNKIKCLILKYNSKINIL